MRIDFSETLLDGKLEATILRLKKKYPQISIGLLCDYFANMLETIDIPIEDFQEFQQFEENHKHENDCGEDLLILKDFPPHWSRPGYNWVHELP